jgi:hypothetical protein
LTMSGSRRSREMHNRDALFQILPTE